MKKTLIITDFDGTLFDTFYANYKSYKTAFENVGLNLDEETYRKCFGLRFNEFMNEVGIKDNYTRIKIKQIKADEYIKNIEYIIPNFCLISFLTLAKNTGLKTCICSTASRINIYNVLTYFKLDNLFNFVLTGEDVIHGKPDPEIYKNALIIANVKPEEALVFEDSETGIQAAINAGIDYIQVTKF